jgi:hypothetical protein
VLYQLAGADLFQVEVEIPAVQLSRLRRDGAEVRIRGSQWPQDTYRRGQFVRLIPVLEEQGRLARVLVELEDPLSQELVSEPKLLLNDLAQVIIISPSERERVRIPLTALQDGEQVWVVRDGRIEVQPIELAYLSGDHAVLEAGLKGGEQLITTRLTAVTDGMRVRVSETPPDESGLDGNAAPRGQRDRPATGDSEEVSPPGAAEDASPPEAGERG